LIWVGRAVAAFALVEMFALGRCARKLVAVRGHCVCDVTGDDYENLI
jgi:hypothetical protein